MKFCLLFIPGAAPYSPGQHDMEESDTDEPYDPSAPLSENPSPPVEPVAQPPPPQDMPEVCKLLTLGITFSLIVGLNVLDLILCQVMLI